MSLTVKQQDLISSQWAKVYQDPAGTAKLFYGHLFSAFPEVRHMFKTQDFETQGKKLTSMIHGAVKKVGKLNDIDAELRRLGRLHVPYGVKPEHYPIVGSNLLWTLEQALGAEFTAEAKQAWSTFYQIIADKMIEGHLEVEKNLSTAEQDLIIAQWAKVYQDPAGAAKLFYGHLFSAFPEVKHLFKTNDFVAQGKKLTSMINMAVSKVRKLNEIDDYLKRLGKLHVPFGVKAEHYPIVGSNLLWTLEQALGDEFDDKAKKTWGKFYGIIAEKMIEGHKEVEEKSKQTPTNTVQPRQSEFANSWMPWISIGIASVGFAVALYRTMIIQ